MEIDIEQEECIICLDSIEKEWRTLACNHHYHKKCIERWMRVSERCPICMRNINEIEMENVHYRLAKRFVILMCCVLCVIIMMVLYSK